MILPTLEAFLICIVTPGRAADWPPANDYVSIAACQAGEASYGCRYSKELWGKDYADAISGGYQGQRNVSFCLSTGCENAVVVNKMLGCAWRFVILESGHLQADSTDVANARHYCGPENVDTGELAAAEAQARAILKKLGVR